MYALLATPKPAPADPPSAAASSPVDLGVLKPRVRTGLDTDRIAALYPDRRMDYFADVRWSGPLDEVLQDLAGQEVPANSALPNVAADASLSPRASWLGS